ncbi:response regulator transcription factor [Vallitalea guaymasensis]|uniref:response regulator transcription factor n=1 Tax=Vallitalea guaymasensis TaxID=1185412 RepID=UPI0023554A33|nr:response regulator transcription factor [Vallitalea guaymasensis]
MSDKINVVIAEDIEVLREEFCDLVNEQNDMVVVGAAASGKEVVQIADNADVDVILMDIEMEKYHDGIEAAQRILQYHSDIAIVFLTVHEDDETVFNAFATGAVDYVVKSSPYEEILESIRNAVKGKSVIRSNIAEKIRNEFSRMKRNEESLLFIFDIISKLTPTERELIRLLLMNKRVSEIAKLRHVEVVTIKSQITSLLKKFQKRRTKEIVTMIRKLKLEYLFE